MSDAIRTCPFFGICGGCKYDFASPEYHTQKVGELRGIPTTDAPVWVAPGGRRRAEFSFENGKIGFLARGSKNVVAIDSCPNLSRAINDFIPHLGKLPLMGAGTILVTECANGIDVGVISGVPFYSAEFRAAAIAMPAVRVTWNGGVVAQRAVPKIEFSGHTVDYPPHGFLQPGKSGEDAIRQRVVAAAFGARRVADLFCGLGNFTFALNADGFDISCQFKTRDLFKQPLTQGMLAQYDCVVLDPPRAGADAQCREIARSNVPRVIYVSCNPTTFARDMETLTRGGYKMQSLTPVDQFVGSAHWELVAVFSKD